MVKYLLLSATVIVLAGCNDTPPPGQAPVTVTYTAPPAKPADLYIAYSPATVKPKAKYVDSFMIEMDSLMDENITLPPIYSHEIISSNNEATNKFSELSK